MLLFFGAVFFVFLLYVVVSNQSIAAFLRWIYFWSTCHVLPSAYSLRVEMTDYALSLFGSCAKKKSCLPLEIYSMECQYLISRSRRVKKIFANVLPLFAVKHFRLLLYSPVKQLLVILPTSYSCFSSDWPPPAFHHPWWRGPDKGRWPEHDKTCCIALPHLWASWSGQNAWKGCWKAYGKFSCFHFMFIPFSHFTQSPWKFRHRVASWCTKSSNFVEGFHECKRMSTFFGYQLTQIFSRPV